MKWRNVAKSRVTKPNSCELRLTQAYNSVFGKDDEDVEIVLSDLAAYTGFYQAVQPGLDVSAYQAGHEAGMRAAFARIFYFLSVSDERLRALEVSAQAEIAPPEHY